MVHTVSPVLRRRGGKRVFLVHFFASAEFDLPAYMLKLEEAYRITITKGEGTQTQSIQLRIHPKDLRSILEEIPRTVQVAYEETEPEKC